MKLLAALLLAPILLVAPPRGPELVTVRVGHEQATGFVAGDGQVMTVAHVLGGGDDAFVAGGHDDQVVVDGRPATIVRVDRRLDLAWLHVSGLRGDQARLGGGGDTRLLGRPAPIVRHIRASVDGGPRRPAFEIRADVAAGDSGAPLVTPTGRVAGVVFARSRTRPGVAYAVAVDENSRLSPSTSPSKPRRASVR
ncbi:MAG TPA: trypsin-like peptidase domain-containing protein [Solirubrobacteraceae bacterium]|nr:trypsin-like peptidase domain-containing protein [Solirubrobacteraceae bacterium]